MDENDKPTPTNDLLNNKSAAFLVSSLAVYGLMRKGNYRLALKFYPSSGGGGLNLYKNESGRSTRLFAIDYHPFWDYQTKQKEWKLHYHRGESLAEMKKHRPYDGW